MKTLEYANITIAFIILKVYGRASVNFVDLCVGERQASQTTYYANEAKYCNIRHIKIAFIILKVYGRASVNFVDLCVGEKQDSQKYM
jgi:hypothetical protein